MQTRAEKPNRSRRALPGGFTLIELLVVLLVVGIMVLIGMYRFDHLLRKMRLESDAREVSTALQSARLHAIQRQTTTIVEIVGARLVAYTDVHDGAGEVKADFNFNPVAGLPEGGTDLQIAEFTPRNTFFGGPSVASIADQEMTRGLSSENGRTMAIFQPDGTLRDTGAFRLTASDDLNTLEIALDTRSGAIEIRKYLHQDGARQAGYYGKASSQGSTGARGSELVWVWY